MSDPESLKPEQSDGGSSVDYEAMLVEAKSGKPVPERAQEMANSTGQDANNFGPSGFDRETNPALAEQIASYTDNAEMRLQDRQAKLGAAVSETGERSDLARIAKKAVRVEQGQRNLNETFAREDFKRGEDNRGSAAIR